MLLELVAFLSPMYSGDGMRSSYIEAEPGIIIDFGLLSARPQTSARLVIMHHQSVGLVLRIRVISILSRHIASSL